MTKLEDLENRMKSLEDNITFLKNLLIHLHKDFQEFKKR